MNTAIINIINTQKELLTIEFRYHGQPEDVTNSVCRNKTITIGIFETLEEAIEKGNKALEILSKHFQVRSDDKFQLHYLFGNPCRLVTNCCYPTNGIQYFAKITPLRFDDLSNTIKETFDEYGRYKLSKEEDM
ncbi:hypothetical protein [Bacteroides sp. 51]|uniref:hypothetical protein n=1 Tax=Bacteroides sp. 51 TaxID=2302938 RepID=UPI0013D1D667|nr:hypothetical protein [Bacteroides sp. 51]NDV83002.1 hypothetical protein [Bacteroides sp. 51]